MNAFKRVIDCIGHHAGRQSLVGEYDMKNIPVNFGTCGLKEALQVSLILVALGLAPLSAMSRDAYEEPPHWEFNDRCVPYELTDEFMLANGVDPDKIISAFVQDGEKADPDDPTDVSGTGNNGSVSPWIEDLDEFGEPIPCDEFHTHRRRTRYEGCHFYDGTPCYFVTTGQLDQNSFTRDAAGRRAFEIGEHFVFYEFTQQFQQSAPVLPDWPDGYTPAPIFTDPYCCGFATGSQTKIMNSKAGMWQDDPIGLWKDGLVNFTVKARDCLMDFVDEDCIFMHDMTAANGTASQQLGYPLVYTGEELFELSRRDLASIRYRAGGDGIGGVQESARYIMCALHRDPTSADLSPGNDVIQGYPAHIEWQPPSLFKVVKVGARGSYTIPFINLFGPTPPPGNGPFAEQLIEDNFHCLQQTGDWCP
jgi:hypothetical protein